MTPEPMPKHIAVIILVGLAFCAVMFWAGETKQWQVFGIIEAIYVIVAILAIVAGVGFLIFESIRSLLR